MIKRKRYYITSERLRSECNKISVIKGRASLVHELINCYGLLEQFRVIEPRLAARTELEYFHSKEYLDHIKSRQLNEKDAPLNDTLGTTETDELYGLCYDCPRLPDQYNFCKIIGGGTISAAEIINQAVEPKICVNWCGGWHHAQPSEASGFCYVNDIVVGIHHLKKKYKKILYIDLDVHHGDAVQNAFVDDPSVFTLSFHKWEAGFFPGTGSIDENKAYYVNFPYKSFITGDLFTEYFFKVAGEVYESFKPEVCVVQCGGDVIARDPLGGTNLMPKDLSKCLQYILLWKISFIFLGGGGYNLVNTSKYWTYLMATIGGVSLDDDIPEHYYFDKYGPDFTLSMKRLTHHDTNKRDDLEKVYKVICDQLKALQYEFTD